MLLFETMVLIILLGGAASAATTWWVVRFIRKERSGKASPNIQLQFQASIVDINQMLLDKGQQALANVYETLSTKFTEKGLNIDEIEKVQSWFEGLGTDSVNALEYTNPSSPLPYLSNRLLAITLEDDLYICRRGTELIQMIKNSLPPGTDVFANKEEYFHVTLFHTSHPSDVRADPIEPSGGVDLTQPNHRRQEATAGQLKREREEIQDVVEVSKPPKLEIDRAVMTQGGVLIICWLDRSGSIRRIRQTCRNSFPGAAKKQSQIIHTSLLRILTANQLDDDIIGKIDKICKQWTRENRGLSLIPHKLWYVHERSFSTIKGDRFVFPFTDYGGL
eukprot:TRINITY_DN348_c0_g1_i5.p1 TRINITY_DN348_c0_g1~~TRINITY_DN348_c0_g1_i5.p1  ORF type:complete len:334 (-),score=25.96 TRINITY_DN348_c0_g1_i5:483-1484(-)